MTMYRGAGLRYRCDNDGCPSYGVVREIDRGREATCPDCGWFMSPAG